MVYTLKKELKVHEDLILNPFQHTEQNKNGGSERIFLSYENLMQIYCIRPATVCGLTVWFK